MCIQWFRLFFSQGMFTHLFVFLSSWLLPGFRHVGIYIIHYYHVYHTHLRPFNVYIHTHQLLWYTIDNECYMLDNGLWKKKRNHSWEMWMKGKKRIFKCILISINSWSERHLFHRRFIHKKSKCFAVTMNDWSIYQYFGENVHLDTYTHYQTV